MSYLVIPVITADDANLSGALKYAMEGFYVGPAKAGTKNPGSVLGKGWQHKTSRDPQVITSWFAGTDHDVFIHLGRSGALAFDVDYPENLAPPIQQAIKQHWPPHQSTRPDEPGRGHYIFAVPDGRRFGNSLGALANGWGELRGENGVIMVKPSRHPHGEYDWQMTGPVPLLPGYLATQIPDAIEASDAATDADVAAFITKFSVPTEPRPELLDIHVQGYLNKVAAGESRHSELTGPLAGAMKEAAAGYLDAKHAADTLESVFLEAVAKPPISSKQDAPRTGAVAVDEYRGILAWAVGQAQAADPDETRARIAEKLPPQFTEVAAAEITDIAGAAEFWDTRPVLVHLRDFARSRRVGPWALLGCVMVRVIAATPPNLVLPPLVGGQASINLFVGIVSVSGGGKGTAEAAAQDAIDLPHVPTLGPGSGEGIGHLFFGWDKTDKELKQHTTAVILSAAEIDTLSALKTRQASTLFPELRKAWMGEPLGFAYVDKEKRLTVPRHSYRLCLSVGIQPANAAPILEDHTAGTPQRLLWFPADDPDAPDEKPQQPEEWLNPLIQIGTYRDHRTRQEMQVCETARAEIDAARLSRLRGSTSEVLDGHALLAQLKVAAALALLDGRRNAITEDDWCLAGVVRAVSDHTRQHVGRVLEQDKIKNNQARAHAEADRAIVIDNRMAKHAIQRVGRSLVRKLDNAGDWISRTELRHALESRDRQYFQDAITALVDAGQAEERQVRSGQNGTEYRKVQ